MNKMMAMVVVTATFLLPLSATVAQEAREIRKTVALTRDGNVSIDTYKGTITIEGWEKPEVDILARIEADEFGSHDEEKVRDTEIIIDATPSWIRIKTDYDKVSKRFSFWGIFEGDIGSLPLVHYTIKMPATAGLKIKDYKSETSLAELKSDVDVNTYKGSVDVSNLEGSLDIENYKGDCRVGFSKLARNSSCKTYKGDIVVALPSKGGFELDADVGRKADFDCDFDIQPVKHGRNREQTSYHGTVNNGGPVLRIQTDKGTVRLVKR